MTISFCLDPVETAAIKEIVQEIRDGHPNESLAQAKEEARRLVAKIKLLKQLKRKLLLKQYPQLKEQLEKNEQQPEVCLSLFDYRNDDSSFMNAIAKQICRRWKTCGATREIWT